MATYCLVIAQVIIEENHKTDFLQQYRSNLQFCRTQLWLNSIRTFRKNCLQKSKLRFGADRITQARRSAKSILQDLQFCGSLQLRNQRRYFNSEAILQFASQVFCDCGKFLNDIPGLARVGLEVIQAGACAFWGRICLWGRFSTCRFPGRAPNARNRSRGGNCSPALPILINSELVRTHILKKFRSQRRREVRPWRGLVLI